MSIDRTELQDSARKLFEGTTLVPDRETSWNGIIQMGWPALTVPEELGGLGEGRAALYTLYRELGRVLAPVPFLPVMLAIEAIGCSGALADPQAWIERLIGGEIVTCSLLDPAVECRADSVTGTLGGVPDADKASHVLIAGRGTDLIAFVRLDQSGVSVSERSVWDESRSLFDVRFDNVSVQPELILAQGEEASHIGRELQVHLQLGLAADSIGAADALLDLTVDYLKTRRQFDRPLALFQALQHRCADLKTMLEAAAALFERCAAGDSTLPFDAVTEAGAVKSHAATMFRAVAEESIQLHGGIGLTSEHPCHLFLKRSFLNAALGGTVDAWETAAGEQAMARTGAD